MRYRTAPSPPIPTPVIRAMRGDSDMASIHAALHDRLRARALALAPHADRALRVVAALHSGLTALVSPQDVADPLVGDVLRRLIGDPRGKDILFAWAEVAPARWGATSAHALVDAIRWDACDRCTAAALIGPCDASAILLHNAYDIAFAIRCWGRAVPGNPLWWTAHVSFDAMEQLVAILRQSAGEFAPTFASCLPWLPLEAFPDALMHAMHDLHAINAAIAAFVEASPVARTRSAHLIARLIDAATSDDLSALTRLACVTGRADAWERVRSLLRRHRDAAVDVVAAAPWTDLHPTVQTTIMDNARRSDMCAAIAIAQGRRPIDGLIPKTVVAFLAALVPTVWDALDAETRNAILRTAPPDSMHLALRSLGLRPEILVHAHLTDRFVHEARRHAPDDTALRWTLLPIAVRSLPPGEASALIAAMPEAPPDAGSFFGVAVGRDPGDIDARARSVLSTPADLAVAVALQSYPAGAWTALDACRVLHDMLIGREDAAVMPLLATLDPPARAAYMPDRDALADTLAHPRRRTAMRHVVQDIAALPLAIAIPALYALTQWMQRRCRADDVAEALLLVLHDRSDLVIAFAESLSGYDPLRDALLPLPHDPNLAHALRALVLHDLDAGRRLSRAIMLRAWDAVRVALLSAPHAHAQEVLTCLSDADWSGVLPDAVTRMERLAADGSDAALLAAFQRLKASNPYGALGLAALAADDPKERARGIAVLATLPFHVRTILPLLRPAVQDVLRTHPVLGVAIADLSAPTPHPPRSRQRRI